MKKLNYLWMLGLLMFAAVNFTACSDDDDEGPGSASELVGLWEPISSEGWEKEDGEIVYEWDDNGEDDFRVKFNSDGTMVTYSYWGGEWHLDGSGRWEYKGGKIYTYYDDEEDEDDFDVVTVKELTSTRMVVEEYEKGVDDDVVYEYWGLSTFRKISE